MWFIQCFGKFTSQRLLTNICKLSTGQESLLWIRIKWNIPLHIKASKKMFLFSWILPFSTKHNKKENNEKITEAKLPSQPCNSLRSSTEGHTSQQENLHFYVQLFLLIELLPVIWGKKSLMRTTSHTQMYSGNAASLLISAIFKIVFKGFLSKLVWYTFFHGREISRKEKGLKIDLKTGSWHLLKNKNWE